MLKGNGQKVWFNGKLLANLTKVEAKITLTYEEIEQCGTYGTNYEYAGWKGDGTLTYKKVDSDVLKLLKDAIKNGVIPVVTITGANLDTGTGKTERANLTGVVITEVMLLKAEAKKTTDEEVPFNFSDYEVMEVI